MLKKYFVVRKYYQSNIKFVKIKESSSSSSIKKKTITCVYNGILLT